MTDPAGVPLILMVEDDFGLADLVGEEFRGRGWEFLHAATGQEAREILACKSPDLVILDYSLPDMNAVQLLDQADVPAFLVTTGAGDERLAVEMMKKGAKDYLVKDGHFLRALPGAVERALHAQETERMLLEAQERLRSADESLRSARKLESLGRMAGGIAHDFNNLFQAIQGNLEAALRREASGAEFRAAVERALKALDKAAGLAHQMLNVSGKSFRRSEAVELETLAQECLASLFDLPQSAPVRFEARTPLPKVDGDWDQLCQVLGGLVANAREALPPHGPDVRVFTEMFDPGCPEAAEGRWVAVPMREGPLPCLGVQDAGPGMSMEVLDQAFDPFFSTHRPGRGLGLPSALGILKGHGAGLWIRTGPGRGTTIRILLLPWVPETVAPIASMAQPGKRQGILLVDDDEDLQETLGEFLEEDLGYRLFQARDGHEAVEVYRRERDAIGLIIMDATMPRMTGPDAFRVIREADPQARAVLCSGFAEEAGNKVAREFGFVEFLKKPFGLTYLQGLLARLLADS
jgi:DNA-binding response OmpR family regulator